MKIFSFMFDSLFEGLVVEGLSNKCACNSITLDGHTVYQILCYGTVVAQWQCTGLQINSLSNRSCTWGMIHTKIISLAQVVPC